MRLIKLLAFAFVAVLMATLVVAALQIVPVVLANPKECPKGQEKKNGCKWVQHIITGHCQWLPAQAVANPWKVVPEGTCPQPQPTYTPFQPIITWTPIPRPTDTRWPTQTPTKPPEPSKTIQPTATDKPTIQTVPALPAATGGVCDTCYEERRQANALETLAAKP